ncbi:Short stop [Strongyloides ratti]|uniref:Short stop n=1 Tax=Strongyloides ratti TaxID=34506 RepID=A0A090MYL2_STRRB|nr:Short stop [Strongyloides ratti]CEF67379.1 Short stop [Strongyloides ratti]
MIISLYFFVLFFKTTLVFLFIIKYIKYALSILNNTNDEINKYKTPFNNSIEYNCGQNEKKNKESEEKKSEDEEYDECIGGSPTCSVSEFSNTSKTNSSFSKSYSNYCLKSNRIPKYVTEFWKYDKPSTLTSIIDNRPPFKKYVTSIEKDSTIDHTIDLKNIEKQIQNQTEKCSCSPKFKVHRISDNNNLILYEFGSFNSIKRHVKIYNSNVTIRVGGGWKSLEEFFCKIDPCRLKKTHYNKLNNTSTLLKQKSLDSNFNGTILTTYTSLKNLKTMKEDNYDQQKLKCSPK